METSAFFIPFITILIAELGDKSFLAVAYLASKTKRHGIIWAGAMSGYAVLNTLTAFAGKALTDYIDLKILQIIAGVIFLGFGVKAWFTQEEESTEKFKSENIFKTAFLLIAISEIGDRTNIATGLFAMQYSPFLVLGGVLSALALVTLLAIETGKWLEKRLSHRWIARIGSVIFIGIGIILLATLK